MFNPPHFKDLQNASLNTQALGAGRAFFVSNTGFMGLVSKDTIVGNNVHIFLGANVPFVVRKRDDNTFMLLEECYAFGRMHGEARQGLADDRIEDIILI